MDREVLHLRDSLIPRYAELIYYGYWYAPEREMLQVALDEAQKDVTGTVRVKPTRGTARWSDGSLRVPCIAWTWRPSKKTTCIGKRRGRVHSPERVAIGHSRAQRQKRASR